MESTPRPEVRERIKFIFKKNEKIKEEKTTRKLWVASELIVVEGKETEAGVTVLPSWEGSHTVPTSPMGTT